MTGPAVNAAASADAVQEYRALWAARCDQLRVLDAEGVVLRLDVDDLHFVERRGEFKIDLGVAAAGFDVALRTIALQITAHPQRQVLALVIRIDELFELVRRERQQ